MDVGAGSAFAGRAAPSGGGNIPVTGRAGIGAVSRRFAGGLSGSQPGNGWGRRGKAFGAGSAGPGVGGEGRSKVSAAALLLNGKDNFDSFLGRRRTSTRLIKYHRRKPGLPAQLGY